jgi:class 3 adenylate cyclase
MSYALSHHDELIRNAVEAHDGFVFKTVGDAFYVAFSPAAEAVEAAIDAQKPCSLRSGKRRDLLRSGWPYTLEQPRSGAGITSALP